MARRPDRPGFDVGAVAGWAAGLAGRLGRAFRALSGERRTAALCAVGLFVALFLPWYQTTVVQTASRNLAQATETATGWGAFSFVEAAVLLVAGGVLTLLFQRAEGRAFHLPGGDGGVITAAGAWACVLVVWRIFDKQGTSHQAQVVISSGIKWGIFVALLLAAALTWAGLRIRAAHAVEPPLPGESPLPGEGPLRGEGPEPGEGPLPGEAPLPGEGPEPVDDATLRLAPGEQLTMPLGDPPPR